MYNVSPNNVHELGMKVVIPETPQHYIPSFHPCIRCDSAVWGNLRAAGSVGCTLQYILNKLITLHIGVRINVK
jgi:hypothetical protein